MTTESSVAATPTPLLNAASSLPLRQDDPVSLLFICKTLGVLALLLLAVFLLLRWYASRQGRTATAPVSVNMRCVQALRLSARTKTYLLDVDGTRVLVSETATGTTLLKLSDAVPNVEPGQ